MRKRNVILTCIAGIMITMLLLLFLFAFALLWGRIVAPSMPNSPITFVWRWIRNAQYAKEFMIWLRQIPFYDACCRAFRDTEGTLEPLKYLLELMGGVSFLLGAINEVKSTRSFGMLMRDVIDYVFPLHLFFQAPLYAIFAVTGYYACLKNVGIAAALCLLGITLCFIYSLIMAWCLFVSPRTKEHLVMFYIKDVMTNERRIYEKKGEWKKIAGTCVLDYARYIGQQWTKGNILQIQRDNKWAQEELLISLSAFWLTADVTWLNEKLTSDSSNSELRVPKDFETVFSDSVAYGNSGARYVLFTKAIPFMKNKTVGELELT